MTSGSWPGMMCSGESAKARSRVVAFDRLADMKRGREDPAGLHMLVVVAGVGGQHDPAARRRDAHALQPGGMSADVMHADARRELGRSAVEVHAVLEDQLHHADHVVDLVAVIEAAMAHVAAGREAHLRVLEVKPCGGEIEERADMVVVHVREDDVLHGRGLDAQQGQALARAAQEGALALARPWLRVKPVSTTKVRAALRISQTK